MAISWGGFSKHLRVGIEVWTDGYDTWTPSVNVYVAYYVGTDHWIFDDNQTLNLGGNAGGSWGYYNGMGYDGVIHIGTYTVAGQGQSYGGGPTYTFSGTATGIYSGAGSGADPSHTVWFTLPARPIRAPSPPGTPTFSAVTPTSANTWWPNSGDHGGSALDGTTLHLATDPNFASIVQDLYSSNGGHTDRAIGSLTPGKQYWARTFAHNAAGWSGASGTGTFTTATRPANAPGSPAFSNVTATGFTAAWADSTDYGGATPTSYRLQVATDSGFATVVSDTSANNRSRAVTGLAPGKKHYARVLTVNAAGSSDWSATTSVDTAIRVTTAPGTPTFSAITPTGFTTSWSAPTDIGGSAVTSYRLQIASDSVFANLISDTSANNLSRAVTGLNPGQPYYARALAVNGAGSSPWSSAGNTTTSIRLATPPGAPAWGDLTPTTGTLAWADSTDYGGSAPTGYRLQLASDASFTSVLYDNTALNRTRSVTGLTPGTTYYARVLTVNGAGSSPWSGSTPGTSAEFIAGGVGVSAVGPDTATVYWAAPSGATPTGYQLQYAIDAAFTTGLQTITGATWGTSQGLTGLAPATTYYVRVRANTASGYGDYAETVSFQTLSGAKVRQGGAWVEGVAYVRQNGQWVIAKVYKSKAGSWVL